MNGRKTRSKNYKTKTPLARRFRVLQTRFAEVKLAIQREFYFDGRL